MICLLVLKAKRLKAVLSEPHTDGKQVFSSYLLKRLLTPPHVRHAACTIMSALASQVTCGHNILMDFFWHSTFHFHMY
uniref:Uncharacterized protein n=1 Tax=Anguilla anguilla TaxID=7936 RepID=A0A0E9PIY8_ANGAN